MDKKPEKKVSFKRTFKKHKALKKYIHETY